MDKTRVDILIPKDIRKSLGIIKDITGTSITDQLIRGAILQEQEFVKRLDAQTQTRQRIMNAV